MAQTGFYSTNWSTNDGFEMRDWVTMDNIDSEMGWAHGVKYTVYMVLAVCAQ